MKRKDFLKLVSISTVGMIVTPTVLEQDGIYLINPDGVRIFITDKTVTVLEFHRLIQNKLDDFDGPLSIESKNVTKRKTDHHIVIENDNYLTEESFKWIYDGSIEQRKNKELQLWISNKGWGKI